MKEIILAFGMAVSGPPQASCMIHDAILEARHASEDAGYMAVEIAQPNLAGERFRVTEYGERFETFPAAGGRRITGAAVLRLEGDGGKGPIFVGTIKVIGTPYTWDESWSHISEAPEVRWLERGPFLTDEPLWAMELGDPLTVGDVAFWMIQSGPLQGFDLVLADCRDWFVTAP